MTNLKDLKKVKSIDLSIYDGVKSKVGKVQLLDEETKVFKKEDGEVKTRQILIESEFLDKDKKITSREYISLKFDKDLNEWAIPEGEKSNATKVLTKFDINSFDELEGKEVVIISKTRNSGKEYLGMALGF